MKEQEESRQENHTTKTIDTCEEAFAELYKQVLFAEYSEETICKRLGSEITYENITTLTREWRINGRSSLNGKRHTLVFDIDGVFNDNFLRQIFFEQKIDSQALELLRELNELLPEANIIFLTSRPHCWNKNSWQESISAAAGIEEGQISLVPSSRTYLEEKLQSSQPLRILCTDAGKNTFERFLMPFFGRGLWYQDLVIQDKNAFFQQALKLMSTNLSNFIFIDSGNYSKEDVKHVIPNSIYIGIKSRAKWDKMVLDWNRAIQFRDILTDLSGIILQSYS